MRRLSTLNFVALLILSLSGSVRADWQHEALSGRALHSGDEFFTQDPSQPVPKPKLNLAKWSKGLEEKVQTSNFSSPIADQVKAILAEGSRLHLRRYLLAGLRVLAKNQTLTEVSLARECGVARSAVHQLRQKAGDWSLEQFLSFLKELSTYLSSGKPVATPELVNKNRAVVVTGLRAATIQFAKQLHSSAERIDDLNPNDLGWLMMSIQGVLDLSSEVLPVPLSVTLIRDWSRIAKALHIEDKIVEISRASLTST